MEQVQVQNLTKIFGSQRAVDDISFSAQKGEILGFLGPNGAGKSTTMKMICAYLGQNSGQIKVCGHDTLEQPIAVKSKIGYLPEHNPMYQDMYVREYLTWLAKVHQCKNTTSRIDEVISLVGLTKEQNKLIGTLSKGYKQRVGLAQAILHDPEVLILDEPTSGLDPNQLVEIRSLIKELGKEKTVIFSSHIMQEVKAICDRVVIINQGQIVANKSIDQFAETTFAERKIVVQFEKEMNINVLEHISNVSQVHKLHHETAYEISYQAKHDVRAEIFDLAVVNHNRILEMKVIEESMEQIFGKLTQNLER